MICSFEDGVFDPSFREITARSRSRWTAAYDYNAIGFVSCFYFGFSHIGDIDLGLLAEAGDLGIEEQFALVAARQQTCRWVVIALFYVSLSVHSAHITSLSSRVRDHFPEDEQFVIISRLTEGSLFLSGSLIVCIQ
jgi:hypothetical protein